MGGLVVWTAAAPGAGGGGVGGVVIDPLLVHGIPYMYLYFVLRSLGEMAAETRSS
jgi:hypothetical protein